MQLAFRPDPMPMSRTRSPGSKDPVSPARVNATDAGPMFPNLGKLRGTRSGSILSRSQMASVWTWEIWCRK